MTEQCKLEWTGETSARISGALTFDSVPALFREVAQRAQGAPQALDLRNVCAADSAGLALLLEWQSALRKLGRELSVSGAPEGLLQLARLAEADRILALSGRGGPE